MSSESLSLPTKFGVTFKQLEAGTTNGDVLTWNSTSAEWKSALPSGSGVQINTSDGNAVTSNGVIQYTNTTGLLGSGTGNLFSIQNTRFENHFVVGIAESEFSSIQLAINAAIAAGGGTVRIREGVYNGNLTLANGVILCGMGATNGATTGVGTIINGTITIPNGTAFCSICDLTVQSTNAVSINHLGGGKMIVNRVNTHRIYSVFSTEAQIKLASNAEVYISDWKSTITNTIAGEMISLDFSGMTTAGVLVIDGAVLTAVSGSFWDSTNNTNTNVLIKNVVGLNINLIVRGSCKYNIANCAFNNLTMSVVQDVAAASCNILDCKFAIATFASSTPTTYPTNLRNCSFVGVQFTSGLYKLIGCEVRDNSAVNTVYVDINAIVSLEGCLINVPINMIPTNICEFNRTTFNGPTFVLSGPNNFNGCIFKDMVTVSDASSTNTFANCSFLSGTHTTSVAISMNGTHSFKNCMINNTNGVGINVTGGTNLLRLYNCTIETSSHCIQTNNTVQTVIQDNNLKSTSGSCINFVGIAASSQKITSNTMESLASCIVIGQAAANPIQITGNSFTTPALVACVTNASTSVTSGYNKNLGLGASLYSGTAPSVTISTVG